MRLAIAILEGDAKRADVQDGNKPVSSFNVRGMGVLLSVFTVQTQARELKDQNQNEAIGSPEELQEARLTLGEGLKRAFVAENAMKKENRRSNASKETIYAANFAKHSREEQERAVMMMLEY